MHWRVINELQLNQQTELQKREECVLCTKESRGEKNKTRAARDGIIQRQIKPLSLSSLCSSLACWLID
jgi:hypothetical protein